MLTRRVERNSWLRAGSPLASLLVLAVHLCTCLHNVDGNVSRLGSVDTFKLVFLENEMQFQITKGFSSDFIAEEFCRQTGLDATYVRAVREIVENGVHDALGDRVYAGMQGEDQEALWFVQSICRDFPRLHRLNQLHEGKIVPTSDLKALVARSEPRRVIDAFPFFNEIEILRVRLQELDPVVDKFVLIESAMTHSGHPKELLFERERESFEPWLDKIVHVVMETLPDSKDHWVRERSQRDGIHEGLQQTGAIDEDILIVSDTDEIPRRSTVRAMSWCDGLSTPAQLRSAFYYYSFQYLWQFWAGPNDKVLEPFQWKQPRAVRTDQLLYPRLTVNHLRYDPGEFNMEEINDAAWHLSFFGGEDRIRTKLEAYAHQEHNVPEMKASEHIQKAIQQGADLFKRGAVHGTLMNTTHPYDLPAAIIADLSRGGDTYVAWLPNAFDIAAIRGSGCIRVHDHDEL